MKPNSRMADKCTHSQMVHCSKCHFKQYPEIIMSGYLVKSPPLNKSILVKRWKKRYFILRGNSRLEYYQDAKSNEPLTVINLEQTLRIEAGLETKKYGNIFDLILPGRTYFFSAGHIELMFEWVRQIKRLLGIEEDVVYPQKTPSKPLTPGDPLLQCYINQSRGAAARDLGSSEGRVGGMGDRREGRNSSDSGDEGSVSLEEVQRLQREEVEFRASLIRSNHYTVISRDRTPVDDEKSGSNFLDPGPQWGARKDSYNKLKGLIKSTSSVVTSFSQNPETRFYSEPGSHSLPEYATVDKDRSDEPFQFKRLKSVEETYEPTPPPIPPKLRPRSPQPRPEPTPDPEPTPAVSRPEGGADGGGLQRRLPSLSRMGKIKVSCSAKEGVGRVSSGQAESGSAGDGDNGVVCFGTIVKKVFGAHGGRITFRDSDTEVEVPSGAILQGHIQGFYFKVSPDSGFVEESGCEGDTSHVCSPLLQFGPVGAKFNEPIRIKMPHCLNLEAEEYQVQLILAYGDLFSPNGVNYLRIDASKEDFELEMFSFNTILGPVVFNLQPEHVTLEISHFVFQWVQLVALSKTSKPGRDPLSVSKRVRLACFRSEHSDTESSLNTFLYNDYSDVLTKLKESQSRIGASFLATSKPLLVPVCHTELKAQISLDDLEFGFKINGRAKQALKVPAKDSASEMCQFKLEKLFADEKLFSCEVKLRINGNVLASLEVEELGGRKSVAQVRSEPHSARRVQLLADTLGLSGGRSPDTTPLSVLSEAGKKLGCEVDQVSEALKQLDAAELISSPKHNST